VIRDLAARGRDFHHEVQAAVCDVIEPWEHGTVVRATRYPDYYDFNAVRVERDANGLAVEELIGFADEALAGLEHRRVDIEDAAAARSLRAGFEAAGWLTFLAVWMIHAHPPPAGEPAVAVEEVAYETVRSLRVQWGAEDFPGLDMSRFIEQAQELAEVQGARVYAVVEDGEPVAFTQVERVGAAAEISQVYVTPARRGQGLGTAVTRSAIEVASVAEEIWIVADDEGRAKELYGRLGFRPAWVAGEFMRLP
jgi:ribosomal protein S18 acetylase RimI-like enzyme